MPKSAKLTTNLAAFHPAKSFVLPLDGSSTPAVRSSHLTTSILLSCLRASEVAEEGREERAVKGRCGDASSKRKYKSLLTSRLTAPRSRSTCRKSRLVKMGDRAACRVQSRCAFRKALPMDKS